jgi:hypothetical protein
MREHINNLMRTHADFANNITQIKEAVLALLRHTDDAPHRMAALEARLAVAERKIKALEGEIAALRAQNGGATSG